MIHVEVVSIVRGRIPKLLGSIKTSMMKFFDEQYAAFFEVASATATTDIDVVGIGGERAF